MRNIIRSWILVLLLIWLTINSRSNSFKINFVVIISIEMVIYNNLNSASRNQFQYSPQFYGQTLMLHMDKISIIVLTEAGLVVILVPGEETMVLDSLISSSAKFVVVLVIWLSNVTIVLILLSKVLHVILQSRILSFQLKHVSSYDSHDCHSRQCQ